MQSAGGENNQPIKTIASTKKTMKTIVKIKGKIETQPSRGGRDKEEN